VLYNQFITIGASGAVYGILLAFGMYFPNVPMYLLFVPVPIKAKYMIIGYGILELFLGITNFSFDNIAHFAHLGGMIFGFILIMYWKKKGINRFH
jgi:membrane associated rhomboid family serine protease